MPQTTKQYTTALARHLRVRGLDERQISEAARMVEAHVADSGATAQEAFGSPAHYARTFGRSTGRWGWYVVAWLVAAMAGMLLVLSWTARDEDEVLGVIAPQVGIVVGGAVLVLWAIVVALRLTRYPSGP